MASEVVLSKVTSKGQATIPGKVRKALGIAHGDTVMFVVEDGTVTLKRADPLDAAFLRLSADSVADWDSPEADEAFRDL